MIVLFSFIYLNSYEFSLRKPGSGRYSWVGGLFYKNNGLISVVSIFIILLFSYGLVSFVKLLFCKSLFIKNESNCIYINEKKIESLANIKEVRIVDANNNKKIYFFLKVPRDRKIAKYIPSLFKKWFRKNEYIYDITFVKEKPAEVDKLLNKLLKLI